MIFQVFSSIVFFKLVSGYECQGKGQERTGTSEGHYRARCSLEPTPQHSRRLFLFWRSRTSMEFHKQKTTKQGPGEGGGWLCKPTFLQDFQAAQLWKNRGWFTYIKSFMKHERVPLRNTSKLGGRNACMPQYLCGGRTTSWENGISPSPT